MTKFMGLSKNLMFEKWKQMNWIVAIDLIFLLAITIIHIFTNGFSNQAEFLFVSFNITMVVANIVAIIVLARKNEQVLTSNNYRLLPVADTKLYLGNLLTALLAFIYLQIIEGVISGILYIFTNSDASSFGSFGNGNMFNAALSVMLLMILGLVVLWTGITLVHLISNLISGFLPFGRQKFVKFVLYLVIIFVALGIFNYTTGNIFKMIYINQELVNLNQFTDTVWISNGIFFAWSVVFSVINIYLLRRWTETVR